MRTDKNMITTNRLFLRKIDETLLDTKTLLLVLTVNIV